VGGVFKRYSSDPPPESCILTIRLSQKELCDLFLANTIAL
jgi:hypothetical protein